MKGNIRYIIAGIAFGFILVKSEVVSWFRIQEMFHFQSIFMYGIIGLAIIVGFISIQIIKRFNLKDIEGKPITIPPKDITQYKRYIIGGIFFGLGWAMLGACPGPLFALFGAGYTVMIIPIISAVIGTWTYGKLRTKLPH
ncbi:MAG TPA: DUF6691 family protein [Balneolales bacterium]|nr:DUF6691 family protein [Balneolales bacterium]